MYSTYWYMQCTHCMICILGLKVSDYIFMLYGGLHSISKYTLSIAYKFELEGDRSVTYDTVHIIICITRTRTVYVQIHAHR